MYFSTPWTLLHAGIGLNFRYLFALVRILVFSHNRDSSQGWNKQGFFSPLLIFDSTLGFACEILDIRDV